MCSQQAVEAGRRSRRWRLTAELRGGLEEEDREVTWEGGPARSSSVGATPKHLGMETIKGALRVLCVCSFDV